MISAIIVAAREIESGQARLLSETEFWRGVETDRK